MSGAEGAVTIVPTATLPRVAAVLRAIARAATAIPIVVAVLVLFGWWSDVELLKRIIPGLVAMNPMTAIGFIFLGLSLGFFLKREASRAGQVLALIATLIGLIKIVALLTPFDLGIDQIFFHSKLSGSDFGLPNRMAPNTALNDILTGLALLTIDRRIRNWWPSQYLAIAAAMSSILALMGYAYGVKSFYGIGSYIPMALHTAAMFFLVAIGTLCARPTRGMMAVVSSNSSGGMMIRRLIPASLLLPAALGWIRHEAYGIRVLDPAFELWLLVVLIMTLLTLLVGWNGRLLFRSDLDRAEAEKILSYQATHDSLTQLPNRRMFTEQLEQELQRAKETQSTSAVLFLDLDLFKVINDSLGHVVGDQLLIAAGQRIRDSVGHGDLSARISGDEFTVLLTDLSSRMRAIEVAAASRAA